MSAPTLTQKLAAALAPIVEACSDDHRPTQVHVTPMRYVTVGLAAAMTGLSAAAIRKRIERGQWVEGGEWRRAPDDRIWIDVKGVERWVEGARR